MKEFLLIFSVFFILNIINHAQTDSIPTLITDRPTQVTSPYIVPKGSLQIETGFVYTNRNDHIDLKEQWSVATTLLRYGIYDHFEIRLNSSYETTNVYVKETAIDSTYSGIGPLTAGFKIRVIEEKGIRPEIAIIGSFTFRQIGDENYRPTYGYPIGKLALMHTLSKRFSLGYNIGFGYGGENADGFFIYAGFLGFYITDRLWSFAEVYGDFDSGNYPNHKLDAGFTFVIRHNLQLDVSTGMGISSDVDKYFINGGISWRIPQ